tara:strand:- start:2293 stop:3003 length:711 start_codon:yes stop_codon:yes gene_type:complete
MLVIDSREKKGSKLVELVESEALKMKVPYEKKWIEIGDYVYDDVCFEAKSAHDFLNSVMSKRMWTQLDNMDRHYQTNVVIIYGSIDEGITQYKKYIRTDKTFTNAQHANWSNKLRNKFLGAIGRITLDTDAKAFWVSSEQEAALIITSICKMKPIKREVIKPEIFKRISTDDLRIDTLTTIKGLSVDKANALIKHYGSIMEIGEQTEKELQEMDGIGKTLARRILNVLHSEEKVKI